MKRIIDLLVISLSSPCYRRDSPIIVTLAADVVCILIVEDEKQEEEEEPEKWEEGRANESRDKKLEKFGSARAYPKDGQISTSWEEKKRS